MLSYRHAFHAGNHADVLKHSVLTLVLDYFKRKDKPFWYVDTHAGAGLYALDSSEARKNAEFETGIGRLLAARGDLPELAGPYLEAVDALNRDGRLQHYPGSPWLAADLLRSEDRLRLFEMHPQDVDLLDENLGGDRRVRIERSDGFTGLKALLPPPPRRAVVLIDPPYELKEDYDRVVVALQEALKRFANGTYIVWYPLLSRAEATQLPVKLTELMQSAPQQSALRQPTLRVELKIENPRGEFGMYGSGLFIVNPPWILREQLAQWLPVLQHLLGRPDEASTLLEASGKQ